ncbi:tRNA lysidine(34) synthetase TilS [Glacieibacterium frigidum]|uniref:tRNA lysidine(34) synthetase TilS n=1 Tax=Glacieibacterium frigidum TaxID=2593303 RepID=UPI001F31B81F|nr:tRNA lysidine(34) synthetase TilS [Glacieibacterium frigidum]
MCDGLAGGRLSGQLAVAISGGPDSLALLILAHAAYGERVVALTVDHGLRAESAGEAAMVASVCAARGIFHTTLVWRGDKPAANVQAAARDARYALMRDHCVAHGIAWLATGHHADDQAETLLMRLARGSGTGGLSGIRARRDLGEGVTLLRPLLEMRRADLRAIVDAAGLAPVDDPANRSPAYDRTAARALLAGTPWLDAARLADAAAHLGEAEAALAWTADLAWDSRAEIGETVVLEVVGLPAELRRRFVTRALAHFGAALRGPETDRLIARLAGGETATLGGVQARGGDRWTFRRARSRI